MAINLLSFRKFKGFFCKSSDNVVNGSKAECCPHVKVLCKILCMTSIAAVVSVAVNLIFNSRNLSDKRMRSYLLRNPNDMLESFDKKRAAMEEEQREEQKRIRAEAPKHIGEIVSKAREDKSFLGNPSGSDLVVVFYDYSCGYCKKLTKDLQIVLKNNKGVKVVLKDLPIMSQNSMLSAKASLFVAHKHSANFKKFHLALMDESVTSRDAVIRSAKKANISQSLIIKAMESDEYDDILRENFRQAASIGISGTPATIVGNELMMGYVSATQINNAISHKNQSE